jgi:hypothetical protein
MKTRLIFLLLLIVCFSCGTNNKPVSDAQKEKIKGEVKEIQNTTIRALEEIDWDMVTEPVFDSPDFFYTYHGKTSNYEEFMASELDFNTRLNQKCTIVDEKYAVLDNSTVLYTMNCTWLTNYKNGHSVLADPAVTQVLYKKIDNRWRVINIIESDVVQSVKNTETSNQLNQVELHKQYIGKWKSEVGKDTIVFWNGKPYGTGLECYFKLVANGKIVIEGKQIWAYDRKADKFILSELNKGVDNGIYPSYFVSKNKCKMLPIGDISNPANASLKWEDEFKSPDMFIHKTLIDDNIVRTDTYNRVK